ncbi:MAG: hypothetical protein QXU40_00605 [Candidatus Pacearchaeota archaeon]
MVAKKKGWVRIVEAFISVLIVSWVVLFILNNQDFRIFKESQEIRIIEEDMLRNIQLNYSLRNYILSTEEEVDWNNFPNNLREVITRKIPAGFECSGKICDINSECNLNILEKRNIYTQTAIITSNITYYHPKIIKIFCWRS